MPTPTRRLLGTLMLAAPLLLGTPANAGPPNFVVAWAASAQGLLRDNQGERQRQSR